MKSLTYDFDNLKTDQIIYLFVFTKPAMSCVFSRNPSSLWLKPVTMPHR